MVQVGTLLRKVKAVEEVVRQRARPHRKLASRRSTREDALGLGVKNEKEHSVSLRAAYRRIRLPRVRNPPRHWRGHTKPWQRLETNSFRIGQEATLPTTFP